MIVIRYGQENELDLASNAVIALIRAGRLDEAERAAHSLLKDFPEAHDGYDRLGRVQQARGNIKAAVEYYRKAAACFTDRSPDMKELYRDLINSLDPPAS